MTWFNDLWARFEKTIPLVEDPTDPNKGVNLKAGPNGGLTVEAAAGATLVDVSTLATQATAAATLAKLADPATETTLASVLAKIIAAPATEAKQDTLIAKVVAAFNATTPTKSDGVAGALATDKRGNLHASLALAHEQILALQGPVDTSWTTETALSEACDGLECNADDVYVYAQLREAPRLISIDPADWTLGAGWTFAGTVATHEAGGGTDDLELTTGVLHIGVPYAILFKVSATTAGTVTGKLGAAGAVARSADGTYIQALVVTVDGKVKFTPTDAFDGAIDISEIWVVPPVHLPSAGTSKPVAANRVLAVATKAAPTTRIISPATTIVKACYYRRAGAVQS